MVTTTLPAPEIIQTLVKRFSDNIKFYKSTRYNEAQLRQEFLDPFFEALGWDVYNKKNFAPLYREVDVERSISFQSTHTAKTPDYTFRLGEDPKFFVEAKRPSENLQTSSDFAFQLKAYAWNKHLPLSILTDFEEFLVFNCRRSPQKTDRPDIDCVMKLTFTDYLDKWDELVSIFSPESIRKGAFDKYAEDNISKKGVIEVDDLFLADISTWRELLARNIALRNMDSIDESGLNYAIQMTIDRIIFLRICEDRGIEPFNQLREITEKPGIYQNLNDLFKRAELKYNSGLFSFKNHKHATVHQDDFTPTLAIDDKALKEIIIHLYYPKRNYNFKAIPVEILGQVYEQFLGKVIRLTPGHMAKIEDKPEVRKAGGVYYTPKYIVDYIVANTVGKLLEVKTPEEVSHLRIVDPACGSGSFLLGAFQYLINWHEDWYFNHDPEKWSRGKEPTLAPVDGGGYRISTPEKKRILINNIYGVDIDAQAVEVTKLSLLLKVLEEESGQLSLGFEHALPDLGNNIQCGNSLIGSDYFDGQLVWDEKEREHVNPFDWHKAFPDVFRQGGFDAVIGNPPYVRIQTMKEWAPQEVVFYNRSFKSAGIGNYDLYGLFLEKGHSILNKDGCLSFIIGSKWLRANYADNLRNLIGKTVVEIIDFSYNQVFENAFVNTCIIKIAKNEQNNFDYIEIPRILNLNFVVNELQKRKFPENVQPLSLENRLLRSSPWQFVTPSIRELINKITKNQPALEEISSRIYQGIKTGSDKVFLVDVKANTNEEVNIFSNEMKREFTIEKGLLRPLFRGSQIKRYHMINENRAIIFPYISRTLIPEKELKKNYPRTYNYMLDNKLKLESRENGGLKGKNWYGYSRNQALDIMEYPKILTPDLSRSVAFAYDEKGEVFFPGGAAGGYGIILKENWNYFYTLGILNSSLIDFYIKQYSTQMESGFFSFEARFIRSVPIHKIDFTAPDEVKQHNRMISLVEHMLELHKRTPQTPHEKERLEREIASTDAQIDRLVYDLYGLTADEIKVVEGG
jgi:type I restriction-modification system DNA methylase subunit